MATRLPIRSWASRHNRLSTQDTYSEVVSKAWSTVCESAPAPKAQAWRHVAPRWGLSQHSWRTSLSVACSRSRRQHSGDLGPTSVEHTSRQDILPEVAQRLGLRATGQPSPKLPLPQCGVNSTLLS